MAFDPLPPPASLLSAVLTIENQLAALDATLAGLSFTAKSSDNKIVAVVNGAFELRSLTIAPELLSGSSAVSLTALASTIITVFNQAMTSAQTEVAKQAGEAAKLFNLSGRCTVSTLPNFEGMAEAFAYALTRKTQFEAELSAMRIQVRTDFGIATMDGNGMLISLVLNPLPDHVAIVPDLILDLINQTQIRIRQVPDDKTTSIIQDIPVLFTGLCLYAKNGIQWADRAKLVGSVSGSYAAMANAGSAEINIGVEAHVGKITSVGRVVLRDRANVHGDLRTSQTLVQGNSTVVTGRITQNKSVDIPAFTLGVTFPASNSGPVTLQPNQSQTLPPGSYAALTVNAGATLSLSSGTYYFTSFDLEPNATLACSTAGGQITIYVSGNVIYRGRTIESTGGMPAFFLGALGTNDIPVGAPYTGVLAAPNAKIILNTVGTPGHRGAFFGKSIQVDPDSTITWYPYSGTPVLGPT